MDNSYRSFNITNDNYLNILVFEKKYFKEIFPNSTDDDYEKTQFSVDYPYEAINYAEEKLNIELDGSRFIVINEKYIEWCKKLNKTIGNDSINEYINLIPDKESEKLWYKSNKYYDLVLCSIPILIKYYYENTLYNRYYTFSNNTLLKAKEFLGEFLNFDKDNIFIFESALTKDDAIVNVDMIEAYFKSIIKGNITSVNLVKSIFNGYSEDCFTLKYVICGVKVNRMNKMTKSEALKDSQIKIDSFLLNDEMASFSEILSNNDPNYVIYPVFDRIITIKEIESSEELLKNYLPELLLTD